MVNDFPLIDVSDDEEPPMGLSEPVEVDLGHRPAKVTRPKAKRRKRTTAQPAPEVAARVKFAPRLYFLRSHLQGTVTGKRHTVIALDHALDDFALAKLVERNVIIPLDPLPIDDLQIPARHKEPLRQAGYVEAAAVIYSDVTELRHLLSLSESQVIAFQAMVSRLVAEHTEITIRDCC